MKIYKEKFKQAFAIPSYQCLATLTRRRPDDKRLFSTHTRTYHANAKDACTKTILGYARTHGERMSVKKRDSLRLIAM